MFAAQALAGHDVRVLVFTVAIEPDRSRAPAAFVATFSPLQRGLHRDAVRLFTSFMAVGRNFTRLYTSGWVADHMAWVQFFVISTLLTLPGLAILGWMMHRFPADRR